jgi:hypothetical protein
MRGRFMGFKSVLFVWIEPRFAVLEKASRGKKSHGRKPVNFVSPRVVVCPRKLNGKRRHAVGVNSLEIRTNVMRLTSGCIRGAVIAQPASARTTVWWVHEDHRLVMEQRHKWIHVQQVLDRTDT